MPLACQKRCVKIALFIHCTTNTNINTCINKEQTQHFVIQQSFHGGLEIEPFNLVTHFLTGECPGTTRSGKPASERENERESLCDHERVGLQKLVLQFSFYVGCLSLPGLDIVPNTLEVWD